MSVLTILQDHCRLHALNVPTAVLGSTDTTVQQLYGILKEVLEEIVVESSFNVIEQEAVFVATATEDQGALTTLAPSGYTAILIGTVFDRTLKRPLNGPLTAVEWQTIKALPNPGPGRPSSTRS